MWLTSDTYSKIPIYDSVETVKGKLIKFKNAIVVVRHDNKK